MCFWKRLAFESIDWVTKIALADTGRHHLIHWGPEQNKKAKEEQTYYLCLSWDTYLLCPLTSAFLVPGLWALEHNSCSIRNTAKKPTGPNRWRLIRKITPEPLQTNSPWEGLKAGGEGMTEDELVGWHHWLNGHEFEQALGDGEGQGSLAGCSPWSGRESDTTEWLNTTTTLWHWHSWFLGFGFWLNSNAP